MSKFKVITLSILAFIGLIVLAFLMELGGLKWKEFFAPKHANVERKVFKQTRSYNEAKVQDLSKLRLEYMREKDPQAKEAIASTIRHMFADYNSNEMPYELGVFLNEIRNPTE